MFFYINLTLLYVLLVNLIFEGRLDPIRGCERMTPVGTLVFTAQWLLLVVTLLLHIGTCPFTAQRLVVTLKLKVRARRHAKMKL